MFLVLRFPYYNVAEFLQRTLLYSSSYAILLMAVVVLAYMAALYRRRFGSWVALASVAVVVGGLAIGASQSGRLTFGGRDLTLLCTLPLLAVPFLRTLRVGERAAWLWFAVLFLGAIFLVGKPDSHVYVFFVPWALLVGLGVQGAVNAWQPRPAVAWGAGVASVALLLLSCRLSLAHVCRRAGRAAAHLGAEPAARLLVSLCHAARTRNHGLPAAKWLESRGRALCRW